MRYTTTIFFLFLEATEERTAGGTDDNIILAVIIQIDQRRTRTHPGHELIGKVDQTERVFVDVIAKIRRRRRSDVFLKIKTTITVS